MEDVVRSVNTEQGKDKVEVVFGNKKKNNKKKEQNFETPCSNFWFVEKSPHWMNFLIVRLI
jgi:hypothetical protein